MRRLRVTLIVAALLTLATVASAQSRGTGTVDGTVRAESGEPVAGAVVNFLLPNGGVIQGKADEAGKWKVTGVGKGDWRVLFIAKGFATQQMKVAVKDEATPVNVVAVVMKKGA